MTAEAVLPTGRHIVNLNAQMQTVIEQFQKFGAPPLQELSPENARNLPTLKNAVEELTAEHTAARVKTILKPMPMKVGAVSHILIPTQAGDLLARVYAPLSDVQEPLPVIVYFHGGGWVIANLDVYDPSCRALANAASSIVVSVAYRQAPEHKFPAAPQDAHAAVQWILANAVSLGGDPARVAVAGESAGGNLATVACLMARDQGGLTPVFQLLIYPVVNYGFSTLSYQEHHDATPLNAAMMPWFFRHYLPDEEAGQNPYVSPLRASNLADLPPAFIITAENDPLCDEGEEYAVRLAGAGVPATSKRYDGVTHEFFGLSGVVSTAREAVADAAAALKQAFAKTVRGY